MTVAKVGLDDFLAAGHNIEELYDLAAETVATKPMVIEPQPETVADQLPMKRDADDGWPVLHDDALHGPLGEIVRTLEPHTEADPAALLADLIVSYGNAVGPGPHAFADGAEHPPRLNQVTVAPTGRGRKGTARANVKRLFAQAAPDWDAHRVMGGMSTGEGLIAAVRDPSGPDDTDAPTDKRLLVHESEFARVLGVAAREGNVLSAVVRDAFDSGVLRVMTRKDPLVATGSHVSINAHITIEELQRRLSDTEMANGFANRFLFILARRSKLLPDGGALPPAEFQRLVGLLRGALEGGSRVGRVTRNEEAGALWADMYHSLAENTDEGLVAAITARAEALLLRLSVVYALSEGRTQIETPHLQAAWAVWCYAEQSARYIWGESTGNPVADKILQALSKAGEEGVTALEQRDLFSGHVTAQLLERARQYLQATGKAITVKSPTDGRPIVVSFLFTHAHKAHEAQKGPWR